MTDKIQQNRLKPLWKGQQRRIGLTGGIGSGKSSVSKFLQFKKNIPIFDTDLYSREALAPGKKLTIKVIEHFGKRISNPELFDNVEINRKALAKIIFENKKERAWLEKLIHPIVRKRLDEDLKKNRQKSIVVIMVPLLFETGLSALCSETWLVYCTVNQQYERIMIRDNIPMNEAIRKVNAQWSLEKKKKLADIVINNSGKMNEWQNYIENLL